ncbi:pseudouridine synthase [Marinithermus hydrothermalis]|uniref:Pseudouridine synthase n=1 Tax=Marinithermus hydrothermalis (strain DSM 14884 / JCM 11576 / T1) TaxID=869210 RepID=F2NN24_MARHT|nr:pseudouridine synthase [Marinithermus hydrothermalis]AEB12763.1 pseudouridine synthase Rsu [Marinithermus hydrothermalis DSM 14884]
MAAGLERIDKILAHLGFGTRKEVKRLLRAGGVRVDGRVVRDPGMKLDPARARLEVAGEVVVWQRHHHVMLYKPAGVVTATRDARHATVLDCLPASLARKDLLPVGRLDRDTEGLLLLTTDGALLHRLTHPRWKVPKVYYAELEQPARPEDAQAFAEGLVLSEGRCLPAELELLEDPRRVRLVLWEGRYHQVKRMFAARGNRVTYLKRLAVGPLELDPKLKPGEARALGAAGVARLYRAVGLEP